MVKHLLPLILLLTAASVHAQRVVDPVDFGAVYDGQTDSTDAVRAACRHIIATKSRAVLQFSGPILTGTIPEFDDESSQTGFQVDVQQTWYLSGPQVFWKGTLFSSTGWYPQVQFSRVKGGVLRTARGFPEGEPMVWLREGGFGHIKDITFADRLGPAIRATGPTKTIEGVNIGHTKERSPYEYPAIQMFNGYWWILRDCSITLDHLRSIGYKSDKGFGPGYEHRPCLILFASDIDYEPRVINDTVGEYVGRVQMHSCNLAGHTIMFDDSNGGRFAQTVHLHDVMTEYPFHPKRQAQPLIYVNDNSTLQGLVLDECAIADSGAKPRPPLVGKAATASVTGVRIKEAKIGGSGTVDPGIFDVYYEGRAHDEGLQMFASHGNVGGAYFGPSEADQWLLDPVSAPAEWEMPTRSEPTTRVMGRDFHPASAFELSTRDTWDAYDDFRHNYQAGEAYVFKCWMRADSYVEHPVIAMGDFQDRGLVLKYSEDNTNNSVGPFVAKYRVINGTHWRLVLLADVVDDPGQANHFRVRVTARNHAHQVYQPRLWRIPGEAFGSPEELERIIRYILR